MQIIRITLQILILWLFNFIGVIIVDFLHLSIPGSIIGLLLLWLALYFKLIHINYIKNGASFLLAIMTLFFIPATVGIIEYPELLTTQGILLVLGVFLSTVFTIYIAGKVSGLIERFEQKEEREGEC